MAGGLSLEVDQLPAFTDWLNSRLKDMKDERTAARELVIDAVLSPAAATVEFCDQQDRLGPFGQAAPQPVYALQEMRVTGARRIGTNHMRFIAEDSSGRLECIAWRAADADLGRALLAGEKLHIAGHLKINEWNGRRRVQFETLDAAFA